MEKETAVAGLDWKSRLWAVEDIVELHLVFHWQAKAKEGTADVAVCQKSRSPVEEGNARPDSEIEGLEGQVDTLATAHELRNLLS